MNKRMISISKHLSLVLRHDPGSVGLSLDSAGWVEVSQLLSAMRLSRTDLDTIVAENNKKRFEFSADRLRIRASQGHSVKDAIPGIIAKGLLKMGRQHVHLSKDYATTLLVAQRRKNPVILMLRAGKAHTDGHKFYIATNGVWLCEHIPSEYLSEFRL